MGMARHTSFGREIRRPCFGSMPVRERRRRSRLLRIWMRWSLRSCRIMIRYDDECCPVSVMRNSNICTMKSRNGFLLERISIRKMRDWMNWNKYLGNDEENLKYLQQFLGMTVPDDVWCWFLCPHSDAWRQGAYYFELFTISKVKDFLWVIASEHIMVTK